MRQRVNLVVGNCMTLRQGKKLQGEEPVQSERLRSTQPYSSHKSVVKAKRSPKVKTPTKRPREPKVVYSIGLWMGTWDWQERGKPLCPESDDGHTDPFLQYYDTVRDAFLLLKVVNLLGSC